MCPSHPMKSMNFSQNFLGRRGGAKVSPHLGVHGLHRVSHRMLHRPWDGLKTGGWFGTFYIVPYIENNHFNWLIFFRGVETTNQKKSTCFKRGHRDFSQNVMDKCWDKGDLPNLIFEHVVFCLECVLNRDDGWLKHLWSRKVASELATWVFLYEVKG